MAFLKAAVGGIFTLTVLLSLHVETVMVGRYFDEYHDKYSQYENCSLGDYGKPCTLRGEKCLPEATCDGLRCRCPAGQTGDGTTMCAEKESNFCAFIGDPHLWSLSTHQSTANINLPCTYNVISFYTTNNKEGLDQRTCFVTATATNSLFKGQYVVSGIQIRLFIKSLPGGPADISDFYTTSDDTIYQQLSIPTTRFFNVWGRGFRNMLSDFEVLTDYDRNSCQAGLRSSVGGFHFKFRPVNPKKLAKQSWKFGLSISVTKRAKFSNSGQRADMCRTPEEKSTFYGDYAKSVGAKDVDTAVIYLIARSDAIQTNPRCDTFFQLVKSVRGSIDYLNKISFVFNSVRVRKQLTHFNIEPLQVAINYFNYQQNGPTDPGCSDLQYAANICEGFWPGDKLFNCTDESGQDRNEPT